MRISNYIFVCILFCVYMLNGQINTYSPYSYFGLGYLHNYHNTINASMGGGSVANNTLNSTNYLNPATYSYLKKTFFEIGGHSSFYTLNQGDLEQKNFISGLLNLGLAFPVSEKIGFSTALLPYSSVGYNVTSEVVMSDEIGIVNYNYSGSGGISRFLFGLGMQITNNISIGLNGNYFFGSIDKKINISIDDALTQFKEENTIYVSDFNIEAGLIFHQKVNGYNLNIAGTISPKRELNSNQNILQHTYYSSGNFEQPQDTILDFKSDENKLIMPFASSIGVSLGIESKWSISIDYRYTNWEEYVNIDSRYSYMIDKNQIIFGGRFIPKKNDIHNYFNRVEYRMGVSYGVGYLDLSQAVNVSDINSNYNDENLMQDITLNIGVGLPINKMSAVANIGLRYGTSINNNSSMIKEDYFTIYFSMALNEKWFNKRKIE